MATSTELEAELTEFSGRLPVGRSNSNAILLRGRIRLPAKGKRVIVRVGDHDHEASLGAPASGGERDWWCVLVFPPMEGARSVELELRARSGGSTLATTLGTLRLVESAERMPLDYRRASARSDGSITGALALEPEVCIAIGTYMPDPQRLHAALGSIGRQSYPNATGLLVDAGSTPERFSECERVVEAVNEEFGGDRFRLATSTWSGSGLERALELAPSTAPFLSFSGQHEIWGPEAIERLLAGFHESVGLVYASTGSGPGAQGGSRRLRRGDGPSLVEILDPREPPSATVFRRELLRYLLPLPTPRPVDRPDLWMRVVAAAVGPVVHLEGGLTDAPDADLNADLFWVAPQRELAARVIMARCSKYLDSAERRRLRRAW